MSAGTPQPADRRPLVAAFDVLLLDLDGVVYLGDEPVPAAVESLRQVREHGVGVQFVTNNARRTAGEVAERLCALGVDAAGEEVVTSAQGAAGLLAERYPAGSAVLVVGSSALVGEVRAAGMVPTDTAAERPVAVVQGYAPEIGWRQLAEATVAVRDGADWVATNLDTTLPSERGPLPGNGSLIAAVAAALDRRPDLVVGKPEPALFELAVRRCAARRPLVVGDRLDTDIEGANRAGLPSLAVLTGVTTPADLIAAPPAVRPTFVAADLAGLLAPRPEPAVDEDGVAVGGWQVRYPGGAAELTGTGSGSGTATEALTALCTAAWRTGLPVRAGDAPAAAMLSELGLGG
ncbi:acid sugar phosphatase [Actinocatenispora thailandica]|uniref:Acid sugar phosphatase n=1 Tax=Actinocatenispora thailandica TaxID=227318 RepID=A0A7R7DPK1_9ACTN|nr:HAD-IIA family hydrolase [Actinocatenispora thailandica]BCJ35560.1 acid sugar phosphatase [Actinocatenispora thailandica]